MRLAFYAPMKPPDHPVPSGDRRMANLLMEALGRAGHEVELASRLRSWDGTGDPARQARLQTIGAALAERLLRRFRARPADQRPRAWLTYHLFYKAPDWIGPRVAAGLAIPYLVAEASLARKRAGGPWDLGHQATLRALDQAVAVILLNPADAEALPNPNRIRPLAPFLDTLPYRAAAESRNRHRRAWAKRGRLDPEQPWLATVAMMRPGDKLESYRLLAETLRDLADVPWQLLVAGDGPARREVESAFAWIESETPSRRVHFAGEISTEGLPGLYAACDVLVWPALNEAYGMALLEAQAAGLPVVAGRAGGVSSVVRDGETGLLTEPGDKAALAGALGALLRAPERRRHMAAAARTAVEGGHGLGSAARRLDEILRDAVGRP